MNTAAKALLEPPALPQTAREFCPSPAPLGLLAEHAEQLVAWRYTADTGAAHPVLARQLWQRAAALSKQLQRHPTSVWLVLSHNPYEVLTACLAALGAGVQLAFPPSLLPQATAQLALQLRAGSLWGEGTAGSQHTSHAGPALKLPELSLARAKAELSERDVHAWREACVQALQAPQVASQPWAHMFTSGTTGAAQACVKSSAQLWGEAALQAELFFTTPPAQHALGGTQRSVVCGIPPLHIFGLLFGVLVPFCGGAAVQDLTLGPASGLRALLQATSATDLVSVPAQLGALSAGEFQAPASLKRVFSSGAPLSTDLAQVWAGSYQLQLVELFGSTETGGIAWRPHPDRPWAVLPGIELSSDAAQRLVVRSPFTAQGKQQALTTRDIVRWVEGGFEHIGRDDDVVKVGGKRLALSGVERFVKGLPGIKDAVALAVADNGLRGQAVWLLVADPSQSWTYAHLRQRLSEHFEGVAMPRRIRILTELPRNAAGKLERATLLQHFESTP